MKSDTRLGPNTASKDILARCMATEDISVEHRADSPTAYFDVENRVLCLPVWKDMDNSIYDMLVGHEVSHALHTPAEGWQDFVGKGAGSSTRHMFINVVEDARIERLIKDKFPGIRRDFASAYKSLHSQDLFEIDGKNLNDLPLIDRLNLYFKVGLFGLEDISFSADEKQYVKRMAETQSFEDVIQLASDLYDLYKDEQDEQQPDQNQESSPESGDESGDESGEGSESQDDQDGDQDGAGQGEGDEESGEDSGQSQEDDTDDGESAESEQGENSDDSQSNGEGEEDSSLDYDDYTNDPSGAGSTQHNYEKGVDNYRDENAGEYSYKTLPNMDVDSIIVDYKLIEELWTALSNSERSSNDRVITRINEHRQELNKFQNQSKPVVNHMLQQFQMKQAADASKRTSIAKTGVLDTITMINYRWSEDIFVKNEVHSDGKNHGIVMFLDWSGSMHGILKDTVKQLLILVEFCRKAGIPYEVYAFSSTLYHPESGAVDRWSDEYKAMRKEAQDLRGDQFTKIDDTDIEPHTFQLYNFLSSQMSTREYKTALTNFWNLAHECASYTGHYPSCLDTGCTPLNEAIIAALDIVPAFQRTNGVQIVNTVFLTDGEGHGIGIEQYRYGSGSGNNKSFLRDKKTRRTYEVAKNGRDSETQILLSLPKDRTGCNTIGIRLHSSKTIKDLRYRYWSHDTDNNFEKAYKDYSKNNFATTDEIGYDENFIVKGDLKVEFDALENIADDASYTKLKNAFMKGNTNKKSSRVIASRIIDIIAY